MSILKGALPCFTLRKMIEIKTGQEQTGKIMKNFCLNVFWNCFGLRISNQFLEFQYVNFKGCFALFCAKENAWNQDWTGTDRNNHEKFRYGCFLKLFWPRDFKSVFGIPICQFWRVFCADLCKGKCLKSRLNRNTQE